MKILLVCESSHKFESGGRVVRYLTKILKEGGHIVKIVVLKNDESEDSFYIENDVIFLPLQTGIKERIENLLLLKNNDVKRFKNILTEFKPEVIHFASFDDGKPPRFLKEATSCGAKVVLQPWTMQFYCAQGFGFREGKKCSLCAGGNYLNALTHNCVSYKGITGIIKRKILHRQALKADVFLSSNSELDSILLQYGVMKSKINRFPVPFDYTFKDTDMVDGEDDFIFFGQPNSHKGLQILIDAFKLLPKEKLKIYPLSLPKSAIPNDNVEIINGIGWSSGLAEAITKAKTVLIPSLWSTSTEYSMCEALLFKKPVIVFNVGVHKDIFKNNYNAVVIEPDNVEAYVNAMVMLNENKELRKLIGQNGYNTLLEVNNPTRLNYLLEEAYSVRKNKSSIEN
ncbi:glycosyltransferase family 4 protein [Pedobacter psychrotolerans]|uniref:glycosyltransferase family 4 protein n=1 Tax=Pedobacter psychrotolerans TaxID=1843235 RepID=UPI003F9A3951